MKIQWFKIWICVVCITSFVMAEGIVFTKKLEFGIGRKDATIHGFVQGFNSTDYTVFITRGKHISIKLDSKKAYFNLYVPKNDTENTPIFEGKAEGNRYHGVIKRSDMYAIKIYLAYKDAKLDDKVIYTLHVSIE
jgi:hypothetical protein